MDRSAIKRADLIHLSRPLTQKPILWTIRTPRYDFGDIRGLTQLRLLRFIQTCDCVRLIQFSGQLERATE